MTPVLALDHLAVFAPSDEGPRALVTDCSVAIESGETVGLVGESGSGKTLSARSVAGLLPPGFTTTGRIVLEGRELAEIPPAELVHLRAHRLGMIFQTPRAHLNPLLTIGDFMMEALVTVAHTPRADAERRSIELLREVGIDRPAHRMGQYPSQLSGGLLQRVMIAATLAMDPPLLLADEITTALDVTTQEEVMALLADLRAARELSVLFITHDLALAGAVCDRIVVMQSGRTIETLGAATMREDARAEYTKVLMSAALPDRPADDDQAPTETGDGAPSPADAAQPVAGHAAQPAPLIAVSDLRKSFAIRGTREQLVAVDGIGFTLHAGASLGIVGESGSGKSTTARLLCGLERADAGVMTVDGESWSTPAASSRQRRHRARLVQMVFQDPYQSLDRRQTIRACLREALRVHQRGADRAALDKRAEQLMVDVRLDPALLDRRPRSLSGGQRQRVAIARALAADPQALVLDEAVSALDVTTRVEILELLDAIRRHSGVAMIMITHDLTVVRRLCDDIIVMRHGRVVERGETAAVLDDPQEEYTRILLDSIPRPGWKPRRRLRTVDTDDPDHREESA